MPAAFQAALLGLQAVYRSALGLGSEAALLRLARHTLKLGVGDVAAFVQGLHPLFFLVGQPLGGLGFGIACLCLFIGRPGHRAGVVQDLLLGLNLLAQGSQLDAQPLLAYLFLFAL